MQRFRNILFVAKGVEGDGRALHRAVRLAIRNEARLAVAGLIPERNTLFWNGDPSELANHTVTELEKAFVNDLAEARAAGVAVELLALSGKPWYEVLRNVNQEKRDLVVVSTEPENGLRRMLFGSLVMNLMRKCPCAVWVPNQNGRSCEHIMVAVDPLEDSGDALTLIRELLRIAGSIARLDQSRITVKTVLDIPGLGPMKSTGFSQFPVDEVNAYANELERKARAALFRLLELADLDDIPVTLDIERSSGVADSIAHHTHHDPVDLLVMGSVHSTGTGGLFIGNTAERVLQQIDCGVFSAKPDAFISPVHLDTSSDT